MKIEIGNRIHFKFDQETLPTILICIVWSSMLFAYARGVINRFPVLGEHTEEIIPLFVIIPTILALPSLINKFSLADYFFFLLLVIHYVAGYVFFPENSTYLSENAYLCLCCVFPYYFIGRVVDIEKVYDYFLMLSTFCIYMTLFYYLIYSPGNKVVDEETAYDNMYVAYQTLPHVAMLMWATLKKFRIWKVITTLLGILFLISCGTRGPLVCLGFFTIVYFTFYMNFKGAIYVKGFFIASFIIVIVFIQQIALSLFKVFTGFNLSTRIIEKFIYGDLGNDSQRSSLRDQLYYALDNGDHFWGLGLFGCQNYGVIYPHFLPLDFISTYGYFTGYVLLFLLFALIVWAIWMTRGKMVQEFIILLFSLSIIKLMLSGTFINEPYFYFLIGLCAKETLFHSGIFVIKPKASVISSAAND